MNDQAWMRWVMQTARTWGDMSGLIHPMGIEAVDNDHRIFTEYVLELNRVIDAFTSKSASMQDIRKEEVVFLKLIDYAAVHFNREERIMLETKCPIYDEHKRSHDYFAEVLKSHWNEFKNGRVNISSAVKLSILDWWVNHINSIDYRTFKVNACTLG